MPQPSDPRRLQKSLSQPARSDVELLHCCMHGDEDALMELYDRYSAVAYSAVLRVLHDGAAAEEILQDIFLQVWRNPGSYEESRGRFSSWISVVARHKAIDRLRCKGSEQAQLEDCDLRVNERQERDAATAQTMAKISFLLKRLMPMQREVFMMAYFDGMTHPEICKKTGRPMGTIKSQLRLAMSHLRKMLSDKAA